MNNDNIKNKISNLIIKAGVKSAYNDFGRICIMYFYQPKRPMSLKKKK